MFAGMSVGKKIAGGFALVLGLMIVVAAWSTIGVGNIVGNAGEVIDGNKLKGVIVQREVDHLNWANQVNALLTDEKVTELKVETDPKKCGFGEWYYGEGRKEAEKLVPELKEVLAKIEEPHRHLHESAVQIDELFHQADTDLPAFLAEKESDHLKWINTLTELFAENKEQLDIQTDHTKCGLGKFIYGEAGTKAAASDPELARLIEAIKKPHKQLHDSAATIQNEWKQRHEGLEQTLLKRLDDHRQWAGHVCQSIILGKTDFGLETDPTKCAFGKFLQSEQCRKLMATWPEFRDAMEECKEPHKNLHQSAIDIQIAMKAGDTARVNQIYSEVTVPSLEAVAEKFQLAIAAEHQNVEAQQSARKVFEEESLPALANTQKELAGLKQRSVALVQGMNAANAVFASQTKPALEDVQGLLHEVVMTTDENVMTDEAMLHAAAGVKTAVIMLSVIAIVIGVFLTIILVRAITRPLRNAVNLLGTGSGEVSSAADHISSASQQLAEGATEQASSLEESSAALEELAGQSKGNADLATQANDMMQKMNKTVTETSDAMEQMVQTMDGIKESSGQISGIIKTIEEIAFQTNLLALNAAVEAARAGEHGKGFAVVAEEVRNLAQRSAEAARNTADLIQSSVEQSNKGTEVVERSARGVREISEDAVKVAENIQAIATASNEQSQGIGQINDAVAQMDKVTQQIASNSEEAAASSEELNSQANSMQGVVGDLTQLVEGAKHNGNAMHPVTASHAPLSVESPKAKPKSLGHNGNDNDFGDF